MHHIRCYVVITASNTECMQLLFAALLK